MFGADNALDTFWGYSRGRFSLGHDFFFDFHVSHFVSLQIGLKRHFAQLRAHAIFGRELNEPYGEMAGTAAGRPQDQI